MPLRVLTWSCLTSVNVESSLLSDMEVLRSNIRKVASRYGSFQLHKSLQFIILAIEILKESLG